MLLYQLCRCCQGFGSFEIKGTTQLKARKCFAVKGGTFKRSAKGKSLMALKAVFAIPFGFLLQISKGTRRY